MDRRSFCSLLALGAGAGLLVTVGDAHAGPIRRARRRVRRHIRVRRRIRRRVATRVVFGRPFWVVPVGLVVGWELVHANRVVVVKEIKVVEREGKQVEVAVVQDERGKTESIEILREDTQDNAKNLQGALLADNDTATPGIEGDEEVEVDE